MTEELKRITESVQQLTEYAHLRGFEITALNWDDPHRLEFTARWRWSELTISSIPRTFRVDISVPKRFREPTPALLMAAKAKIVEEHNALGRLEFEQAKRDVRRQRRNAALRSAARDFGNNFLIVVGLSVWLVAMASAAVWAHRLQDSIGVVPSAVLAVIIIGLGVSSAFAALNVFMSRGE